MPIYVRKQLIASYNKEWCWSTRKDGFAGNRGGGTLRRALETVGEALDRGVHPARPISIIIQPES